MKEAERLMENANRRHTAIKLIDEVVWKYKAMEMMENNVFVTLAGNS